MDLDELDRLAAAATPGPWWPRYGGEPGYVYASAARIVVADCEHEKDDNKPRHDSQFIAAARTAIPALVARVRELEAALDRCDMVMDTAAIHGLPQELPDVYRNSWAAAHIAARAALKK